MSRHTLEAPVDYASDSESTDDSFRLPSDIEEEVDISIHFHCEHCVKLSKCAEKTKDGWCCEIIRCRNDCGSRFHACKTEEHEMLCSNVRISCINSIYGCPKSMFRHQISSHLSVCPASVVVCNAEWNRWALGARERELVTPFKGTTALFNINDLDISLALHDQRLVNDMHLCSKEFRSLMCNKMTKRFPSLPLSLKGVFKLGDSRFEMNHRSQRSQSTTDDEEEGLVPGLSRSVCTELLRGKKGNHDSSGKANGSVLEVDGDPDINRGVEPIENDHGGQENDVKLNNDLNYLNLCCSHGILKGICIFCRNDPEAPHFKVGNVWRERIDLRDSGSVKWVRESRVKKIRKKGPFDIYLYKEVDESDDEECSLYPSSVSTCPFPSKPISEEKKGMRFKTPPRSRLVPEELILELGLKHYSRHQVKPRAMFTFLCLETVRRDAFANHYKNVHTEIHEGLDGWIMQRCPLHFVGCPFSVNKMSPGGRNESLVFCDNLQAFGVKPDVEPCCWSNFGSTKSPSVERALLQGRAVSPMKSIPEDAGMNNAASEYIFSDSLLCCLPTEILLMIATYLDDFSLNQMSMTCKLLRDVCFSLRTERGLVTQEWVRFVDEKGKVTWTSGKKVWYFSKCFSHIRKWKFQNEGFLSNHLQKCPFNNKHISVQKFKYFND